MYDVVIIGGGPVGSFTAHLLARQGLRCAVVEEHSSTACSTTCTGILGAQAFSEFDLPQKAIQNELRSAKFFSPSGVTLPLHGDDTKAYVLDREAFDHDLYRQASAAGAHFLFKFACSKVEIGPHHVKILDESHSGHSLEASVAIICTGVAYELIDQLGLKRPTSFMEAAQVEAQMDEVAEVEVYFGQQWTPGAFAWVVPLPTGRARIGLSAASGTSRRLDEFLSSPPIKSRLGTIHRPMRTRPIPLETARPSYLDRVLVAGDAAGQAKPTTGGGLYYGFIGASAAAETVASAFSRGDFSSSFLRQYEQRWRERIGLDLLVGRYFRRLTSKLTNSQIDFLLGACGKDGLAEILRKTADFDSHKKFILRFCRHPLFWKILRGA